MSVLGNILSTLSGGGQKTLSQQLLFDKVIGFRGVSHGAGATTCIYNVAAALAEKTTYSVCVIDTHILYPTLQALLVTTEQPQRDWFDFTGALTQIICDTKFKNVKYIGFYKRTLIDLLSAKDSRNIVDTLMAVVKNVFDVVLVDISDEFSVINTYMCINCNKIYTVVTPEIASIVGFKTAINTAVSLAVPAYKMRKCIVNKSVGGNYDGKITKLLTENGFKIIAQIPYCTEIVKYGMLGEPVWAAKTTNKDITATNSALQVIVQDILEVTDKNKKYVDSTMQTEITTTPETKPPSAGQQEDAVEDEFFITDEEETNNVENAVTNGADVPADTEITDDKAVNTVVARPKKRPRLNR